MDQRSYRKVPVGLPRVAGNPIGQADSTSPVVYSNHRYNNHHYSYPQHDSDHSSNNFNRNAHYVDVVTHYRYFSSTAGATTSI